LTKILVIGIAGRMGKTIAGCIEDTEGVELGGGTEQASTVMRTTSSCSAWFKVADSPVVPQGTIPFVPFSI